MPGIIKRYLKLAGPCAGMIRKSFVLNLFEGLFAKVPVMLVLYALTRIVRHDLTIQDVWIVSAGMLAGIVLRILFKRFSDALQGRAVCEIFTRERMTLGDRLKRFSMGFFSEGNIGDVTSVLTSDLVFIEERAMMSLPKIVSGYIATGTGVVMMLVFDYRIGIITAATVALALLVLRRLQKVAEKHSGIRQSAQASLVGRVLEYVKGIGVIRSFNMTGNRAGEIRGEFRRFRDVSLDFERKFVPPLIGYDTVFALGIGCVVSAAAWFAFRETLTVSLFFVLLIFIFELFQPLKAVGGLGAIVRIMEAALNRFDIINEKNIIDEKGKDIELSAFDIEFDKVSFAYDHENVIKDMSFSAPERSMTALVGRSGCGKTTVANLIARFWDVQQGAVRVGGIDVKTMSCDSLLANISMVFQNVYLFHDTILNNLTFGKPEASIDEAVEACRKARCHDFIMNLDNGYDTIVGEGGATLSGGEKQRISIARAILKDAPIILLDEATASVDPDNEKYIQQAINELVREKTLIVIAHRLSTIKGADQIIVIDEGKIVQRGTHMELIEQEGWYIDFWRRRSRARSWEIIPESPETARYFRL